MKKKRGKIMGLIVTHLLQIVTVFLFVLAVICFIVPMISPEKIGYLQLITFFAPFIYLLNFIALLYWLIRFKWFVCVPVIALLFSIGGINKIFQFRFFSETESTEKGLKIMSYNVRSFYDKKYNSKTGEAAKFINQQQVDILAMQEYASVGNVILPNLNKLQYKRTFFTTAYNSKSGIGLAIYSIYPIIGWQKIGFDDSANGGMYADIKIKKDTVRVFNIHLQTTSVTRDEVVMFSDKKLVSSIDSDKEMEKVKGIGRKLRKNNIIRSEQAREIKEMMEESPYPVILCGDFNDIPISYTYRLLAKGLNDAFIKGGRGYGHTFRDFFSLLRIDYVLYSDRFSIISYTTEESTWSDHDPLIVKLKLN